MLVHISLRSGTLDVETASESTRRLRSMMKVLFLSYLLAHRIKRLQGTSRKLMNPSSTFTTFMSHTQAAYEHQPSLPEWLREPKIPTPVIPFFLALAEPED